MISKWVTIELEGIDIGDKRLNNRIMHLLTATYMQPEKSITRLFHTRTEVQACYRFFSNDLVDENKIITPHLQKTIARASEHPVVLSLSDTTSLNYTSRHTLKDSGYISSNNAQGFFLHTSIAVTPDRLHLGIVGQKFWAREKEKPKRVHREYRAFSDKESYRWLEAYRDSCGLAESCKDSKVIHVTDREGDIFEIFSEHELKTQKGSSADYIIRSNHNRTVYTENKPPASLYEELEGSKVLAEIGFDIINREDGSKRHICQTIQALSVITKSRYGADEPHTTVRINAIYLKEINPPEGEKPVNWCLVTSLPIDNIEGIQAIVQYYLCRWEIEVFFKTFKSGCKVEEKSLRSADRLFPLFSLYLILAWRINYLLHMSRVAPEVSCDVFFENAEWKAAYLAATRKKIPPTSPPNMEVMLSYLAKLGGYLGRKKDPSPGIKVIWLGMSKLSQYVDAWELFGPESRAEGVNFVKKTYA